MSAFNLPPGLRLRDLEPVPDVAIEEDGDEIFTPMPKRCPKCIAILKRNRRGFMACTKCGASYGKARR